MKRSFLIILFVTFCFIVGFDYFYMKKNTGMIQTNFFVVDRSMYSGGSYKTEVFLSNSRSLIVVIEGLKDFKSTIVSIDKGERLMPIKHYDLCESNYCSAFKGKIVKGENILRIFSKPQNESFFIFTYKSK